MLLAVPTKAVDLTETKLARTLEVGRISSVLLVALPTGEWPRGSGEEGAFWFSNIARRLRTPPLLARFVDMATRGIAKVSGLYNLVYILLVDVDGVSGRGRGMLVEIVTGISRVVETRLQFDVYRQVASHYEELEISRNVNTLTIWGF